MITTDRIYIRPYVLEDAELLYIQLQEDKEYLSDYFLNMVRSVSSVELAKEYIEKKTKDWSSNKGYACGIFLKDVSHFIGHISIREIDWRIPKGELAYFILSPYAGKNYASEALMPFREWCFMTKKFNRLFMKIAPSNTASIRVAEKSGFTWEGLLKKDYSKREQTLIDMNIYGFTC